MKKNKSFISLNNEEDYFKLSEIKKNNCQINSNFKNINLYKENPKKKTEEIKKNLTQSSKLVLYANFNCKFFFKNLN